MYCGQSTRGQLDEFRASTALGECLPQANQGQSLENDLAAVVVERHNLRYPKEPGLLRHLSRSQGAQPLPSAHLRVLDFYDQISLGRDGS
jgi:hypothetical protein